MTPVQPNVFERYLQANLLYFVAQLFPLAHTRIPLMPVQLYLYYVITELLVDLHIPEYP